MDIDFSGLLFMLWCWGLAAALALFALVSLVLAARERRRLPPDFQGLTRWGKRVMLAVVLTGAAALTPFMFAAGAGMTDPFTAKKELRVWLDDAAPFLVLPAAALSWFALRRVGRATR